MKKHLITKVLIIVAVCLVMVLGLIACVEEEAKYTATFVANGGKEVAAQQDVTVVESAPVTTREGYTFEGWYTDKAFTEKAEFPFTLNADTTFYAKWQLIQYEVTFVTNGGSAVESITDTVIEEAPVTAREGYTFEGWYLDEDLTEEAEFPMTLTDDATLYAKWTLIEYEVTFVTNGGSDVNAITTNVIERAPVSHLDHYTLVGWFADEELTDEIEFPYTLTEETTLYAKWTPTPYTAEFVVNGGSVIEDIIGSVEEGIETAPVTTRYAYTFEGWYLDEDLTEAAVFPYEFTDNVSFYAKWTVDPDALTVTFDYAGATSGNEEVTRMVMASDAIGVLPAPVKFGYDFVGWYDGENVVTADTVIDTAITFTAQWTPKTLNVTIDYNVEAFASALEPKGIEIEFIGDYMPAYAQYVPTETQVVVGETLSLINYVGNPLGLRDVYVYLIDGNPAMLLNNCNNPAYVWTVDGEVIDLTEPVIADGDFTVKIVFETITITFDPGLGTFANPDEDGIYVLPKNISSSVLRDLAPDVERENYTNTGWNYPWGSSSTEIGADATYTIGNWNEIMPKLTFDANGGTLLITPAHRMIHAGETIYMAVEVPFADIAIRPGYTLEGWYDEDGVRFTEEDAYPDHKDRTLFAKWENATFTVTLDYKGGTGTPETLQVVYDHEIAGLGSPVKDGYTFGGWYDTENVKVENGDVYVYTDNVTLFARWVGITPVTITLDAGEGSVDSDTVQLTEGVEIGQLPVAEREGYFFLYWTYNGVKLEETTVFEKIEGIDTFVANYTEAYSDGLIFNYNSATDTYSVAASPDVTGDVVIPADFDDGINGRKPITKIEDRAFLMNTTMTSVSMRAVTEIGISAFSGCSALTSVTLSDNIVKIGYEAFKNCTALSQLNEFSDTLEEIGASAFSSTKITSVVIPASVVIVGGSAFYSCRSLTSLVFEEGSTITEIPQSFLSNCSALTTLVLPKNLTGIQSRAFEGTTLLATVEIPDTVTSIGQYAFTRSGITSFTAPTALTSIEVSAFDDAANLVAIDFGEEGEMITIKSRAFSGTSIVELTLTGRVASIAGSAFSTSTLTTVTVTRTDALITGGSGMFASKYIVNIYVPEEFVEDYKVANYWANFADKISAIPAE